MSLVMAFTPFHRMLLTRWEAMREQTQNDTTRLGIDLFLEAGYSRTGNLIAAKQAEQRILSNPNRQRLLANDDSPSLFNELRQNNARMAGR